MKLLKKLIVFYLVGRFSNVFSQQVLQKPVDLVEKNLEKNVVEVDKISKKFSEIKKERSNLKRETYKKEVDLKQDIQDWKKALKDYESKRDFEILDISRRLELLELKSKKELLLQERAFVKKFENAIERKATLTKLKNQEKSLLKQGASYPEVGSDDGKKGFGKKLLKINKEREKLEKLSQENYIPDRLAKIKKELEYIELRTSNLEKGLSKPKEFSDLDVKKNIRKAKIALNELREEFHEKIAGFLKQEQEIESNVKKG